MLLYLSSATALLVHSELHSLSITQQLDYSFLTQSWAESASNDEFCKNRTLTAAYKLLSFTASSKFTPVLPYVSPICAIHLYLPVRVETLGVKYKHQESFNDDLDVSGKFGKQLEVGLLCWEHEGCLDCAAP